MTSRPNPAEEGFRAALSLSENYARSVAKERIAATIVGLAVLSAAFAKGCDAEKAKPAATSPQESPLPPEACQPGQRALLGAPSGLEGAMKSLFCPAHRR